MAFTHLHVHSEYSLLDGACRIRDLPKLDPAVYQEALDKGLFLMQGDSLVVPTEPKDMRKPCLEFFMAKAAEPGKEVCAEIFREIGEYMAVTWQETDYILQPEAQDRTLFGRLVKNPVCHELMCEGAARRVPDVKQYAADGSITERKEHTYDDEKLTDTILTFDGSGVCTSRQIDYYNPAGFVSQSHLLSAEGETLSITLNVPNQYTVH